MYVISKRGQKVKTVWMRHRRGARIETVNTLALQNLKDYFTPNVIYLLQGPIE